jgi:hypothetical protein
VVEDDGGLLRYETWARSYTDLFRHCERSGFKPLDLHDALADKPWRLNLSLLDCSSSRPIDLRRMRPVSL